MTMFQCRSVAFYIIIPNVIDLLVSITLKTGPFIEHHLFLNSNVKLLLRCFIMQRFVVVFILVINVPVLSLAFSLSTCFLFSLKSSCPLHTASRIPESKQLFTLKQTVKVANNNEIDKRPLVNYPSIQIFGYHCT